MKYREVGGGKVRPVEKKKLAKAANGHTLHRETKDVGGKKKGKDLLWRQWKRMVGGVPRNQ